MPIWRTPLEPQQLRPDVLRLLELILLLGAFTRGLDYLRGVDSDLAVLPIITALLPEKAWGFLFGGGFAVLAVGFVTWTHLTTWAGHVVLASIHAGFLLGAALVTLPALEFRIVASLLLPTVIHALLARHLGPVPARRT